MNKDTELIAQYLRNELNAVDKQKFETRLQVEPNLREQLALQEQLLQGIEQAGRRAEVKSGVKAAKVNKTLKKIGTWTIIAVAAAAAGVAINNYAKQSSGNIKYQLNEENQTNWAQADKVLPSQQFEITAGNDTVLSSKDGLLFAIPANAFLDSKGNAAEGTIDVEIKEALNPLDIMKAGLSTMSNGTALETGGMFYINARKGNENLKIRDDKAITAAIPNLNKGKEMLLFDGERSIGHANTEGAVASESHINWVNPRPFESKLSKRDILKLNFYPLGFLDTLKAMGFDIKNKVLTDSIYYSISCLPHYTDELSEVKSDSAKAVLYASSVQHKDSSTADTVVAPNGQRLFKQNCSHCHTTGTDRLTGPGLAGIFQRIPSAIWIRQWIKNNQKLIKSGEFYANKIYNAYGMAQMPVFEGCISDADIDAILDFLASSENNNNCEIDPMRVRAIWKEEYNGTILATKEFEKRLAVIFKTCNAGILEIYTKGLNLKLYQCDSIAAERLRLAGNNSMAEQFIRFYLEKKGGVLVNEKHLQKLNALLDERTKTFTEARDKALKKLYEQEQIKSDAAFEKRFKHDTAEGTRLSNVLQQEIEMNLEEAYRQLGKTKPKIVIPPDDYLMGTIVTTGWKNVDAYVKAATIARSTMTYVDPESSKKAEINYLPFNVVVKNAGDFDYVNAYLLPKQLSSFNRMKALSSSEFELSLNEFIEYNALVLGFKGEDVFSAALKDCKKGNVSVRLKKMSTAQLKQLEKFETQLVEEIEYLKFEAQDNKRIKKLMDKEAIIARLRKLVFPCCQPAAQALPKSSPLHN